MPGAAVSRGTIIELARILFRERNEFTQILHGNFRVDDKDVRHLCQQRDRHEVLVHVVRLAFHGVWIYRQRADVAEDQRVAVGCGLRHLGHCNGARAARTIVDDDAHAEERCELGRDGARDDLRGATRSERNDDADGLLRIALRMRSFARNQGPQRAGEDQQLQHRRPCGFNTILDDMACLSPAWRRGRILTHDPV